jgi:hypothetical protein
VARAVECLELLGVIIDQIPDDFEEHLRDERLNAILPCTIRPWFYHERRFADPPR